MGSTAQSNPLLPVGPSSFEEFKEACDAYEKRSHYTDSLVDFRNRIRTSAGLPGPDSELDLGRLRHRVELVDWLNHWGCMLPKRDPEHRRTTLRVICEWWRDCNDRMPGVGLSEFDALAEWCQSVRAHPSLLRRRSVRPTLVADVIDLHKRLSSTNLGVRVFGSVAASKTLFVLRPDLFVAWDNAMMNQLGYRGGSSERYALFLNDAREVLTRIQDLRLPPGVTFGTLPTALGKRHQACTVPELVNKYLFARAHQPKGVVEATASTQVPDPAPVGW